MEEEKNCMEEEKNSDALTRAESKSIQGVIDESSGNMSKASKKIKKIYSQSIHGLAKGAQVDGHEARALVPRDAGGAIVDLDAVHEAAVLRQYAWRHALHVARVVSDGAGPSPR